MRAEGKKGRMSWAIFPDTTLSTDCYEPRCVTVRCPYAQVVGENAEILTRPKKKIVGGEEVVTGVFPTLYFCVQ